MQGPRGETLPSLESKGHRASRVALLQALLDAEYQADALLVSALHDVRWAVGFTGSNALLVVTRSGATLLTDGRYDEQARREVRDADVSIVQGRLSKHAADKHLVPAQARLVIQGDQVTVTAFEKLQVDFPGASVVAADGMLDALVAAKEEREIEQMRAAQAVTDDVFEALLSHIRPGVSERELAARITFAHLERGASSMSFEPIVASGPNSALPHARPTDRVLVRGDVVLIDMGAYVGGYSSDMTRTVVLGTASDSVRRAYHAVLRAQEAAIERARAGITGSDLDEVARSVLDEAGYGDHFSHSLGHGVGLRVHEWPRLSQQVSHKLPVGATVTVEPGVYFPGQFGIRIEDIVALNASGCENLTRTPKALLELA